MDTKLKSFGCFISALMVASTMLWVQFPLKDVGQLPLERNIPPVKVKSALLEIVPSVAKVLIRDCSMFW